MKYEDGEGKDIGENNRWDGKAAFHINYVRTSTYSLFFAALR